VGWGHGPDPGRIPPRNAHDNVGFRLRLYPTYKAIDSVSWAEAKPNPNAHERTAPKGSAK